MGSIHVGVPFAWKARSSLKSSRNHTGNVLAIISGSAGPISGDEIWYNPGDGKVYFGATNVAVVDTSTNQFLGYVTNSGGHSIAVDPNNNNIYVPVTGVGIKVFQPLRH